MGHQVIPITQELLYDPKGLQIFFNKEKPDYIFHLAAYGNHSNQEDVPMTIFSNIIGTFNMLSASADIDYKTFINFSSSSVALDTFTYYAAAKVGAEALCRAFVDQKKKPILIVRPFSVYGEGEADFRFIPTICKSLILTEEITLSPNPVHDWIYVEDFIDLLLANIDETGLVNIGTGIATSNKEIVEKLVRISNKSTRIKTIVSLRSYDNNHWKCPDKLKTKHTLDTGLLNTYKYYEKRFSN